MVENFLFFIEDENVKGKTKRFNVYSNHSNAFLGVIRWNCAWRCYVMEYANNIQMSVGCHEELNKKMRELEELRSSQSNNKASNNKK